MALGSIFTNISFLHFLQYAGNLIKTVSGLFFMKCGYPHIGHLTHSDNIHTPLYLLYDTFRKFSIVLLQIVFIIID